VVSAADPLRSLISVFYTGAATFLPISSSFNLTRLSGPRSRPTATHKAILNKTVRLSEKGTSGVGNCPYFTPIYSEIYPQESRLQTFRRNTLPQIQGINAHSEGGDPGCHHCATCTS
jgi:hypothetical protein